MFFEATQRIARALAPALLLAAFGLGTPQSTAAAPAQEPDTAAAPRWSDADIAASRMEAPGWRDWPARPQWRANPMDLVVVAEEDGRRIALVDGGRFEVVHRFSGRPGLRGALRFTPDGRYAFLGSRDGWITRYDLWNLKAAVEVRAGIELNGIAVSADGRWVIAANAVPHTAVLFDAALQPVRTYPARTRDGARTSPVAAVYDAAPRRSFIAALQDIPELWEISYDPGAPPIYDGLVHDYRMGEAIPTPGYQGVRRTPLDQPLRDLFFSLDHAYALGRVDGTSGIQVVNLDVRRKIAALPMAGTPRPGAGAAFDWQGTRVLAVPHLEDGAVSVIDMKTWRLVKRIATPGPGRFVRSHEATPYAWADASPSPQARHTLTLIDKRTLEPRAGVQIPLGQTLAHIAFTRDGKYLLASLSEDDGALIVYDAATLQEVRRLPMRRPVGAYSVFPHIGRPEGAPR